MKLQILMLALFTTAIGARADIVPLCTAQDAAALAGTTCAIADKAFTFGGFTNRTGISIGFIPDVGDSGFTLTGFTDVADPAGFVFYELPYSVVTLDGTATISGLATQISNPVLSGTGPENCDRPGCHISNSPFVQSYFGPSPFPFDEFHLENGSLIEFASGSIPVSPTNALSAVANTEGGGDLAGFTSAHFEILQSPAASAVPEPSTLPLLAMASLGVAFLKARSVRRSRSAR